MELSDALEKIPSDRGTRLTGVTENSHNKLRFFYHLTLID
jgi:hypothetical protein